jgi:hypothetical protein
MTASIGDLAREIVLRAITNCTDLSERKTRIMIAREHGLIDDADAAALIKIYELGEA